MTPHERAGAIMWVVGLVLVALYVGYVIAVRGCP